MYSYLKTVSERTSYFLVFVGMSLYLLFNGYAAIVTNDDWMLYNLLRAPDFYGTLMMGYPLSYVVHSLYQTLPWVPWYSLLLSSLLFLYSYFMAHYIAKTDSKLQKTILFISAMLLVSFYWLHMTITALAVLTMVVSLGFVKKSIFYALAFLLLSFMLREGLFFVLLPFWGIGAMLIRNPLQFSQKDFYILLGFIVLLLFSIFVQNIDKDYSKWKQFNHARSLTSDMNILDPDNILTKEEKFLMSSGWVQDDALLSTEKIIEANSNSAMQIIEQLTSFNYLNFFQYRLAGWLYLLVGASLLIMYLNKKSWKVALVPLFILGVLFLIVMRDADRVTIPFFILWAFIVTESIKKHKTLNIVFLSLFVLFFLYYSSASMGYRYFKENTALKYEAKELMKKTGISCELSLNFPTKYSAGLITLMQVNYLFHEKDWLKVKEKEIMPNNWVSRHPLFYKSHQISYSGIKRKFDNYHDYLLDKNTGFLGSKEVQSGKGVHYLLNMYDNKYLSNKPECRHVIALVAQSQHFTVSQMRVMCGS